MKQYFSLVCTLLLLAITSPSFAQTPDKEEAPKTDKADRIKQYDDLMKRNQLMTEEWQKHQAEQATKAAVREQRSDELFTKSEKEHERFGKILDRWEAQQTEYQKYLDSLPTAAKKAE